MKFLLNTGRTIKQGSFVERKNSPAYREEAASCHMNPVDMMNLDIEEDSHIRVVSLHGSVVMRVIPAPMIPRGELFVCIGPYANHVVGPETHATGMPDFKGTEVTVDHTDDQILPVWKLMEACGGWRYEG